VIRLALLRRQWLLSLVYVAAAWLAIEFTRLEGGVAQLWAATAVLLAALIRTATRHWWAPILACVVPLALLVILLDTGLGREAALPFLFINSAEALIAAWLLRCRGPANASLASHGWVRSFVFAAFAAPLAVLPLVAATLAMMGGDPLQAALHYAVAHALGNLIFTPLALMLTGRRVRREVFRFLGKRWKDSCLVLFLSVGTTAAVFGQSTLSMLFVASLAAIISTFRLGRHGAAISIAILAALGGVLTSLGHGPIFLMALSPSEQLLFFKFFLGVTVLTVLPIAAELETRKALLRRVRNSEERFRLLAEHSSDILMHIGNEGRFRYVSPSMEKIAGHAPGDLVGRNSVRLIAPEHRDHVAAAHRQTIEAEGETVSYEYLGLLRDGERRWFEVHARVLFDHDGSADGVLSIARDISHRKAVEAQLLSAANSDMLTGLPNRRAFEELVERRSRLGRHGRDCVALLDLDRFKSVNDTYGHDSGDSVLRGFAEALRRLIRAQDTVARLGGEEFVILFEDTSLEQAYQVCDRMRRIIGQTPLATPAGPLRVTVSGGVAVIGSDGLPSALKAADAALYRAKKGGRDQLLLAA
jgi:diguanylate cyclase (GGDEF)-like protein/PAS domain S-box-containing protein